MALKVFLYQARHTPVYGEYLDLLKIDPARITSLDMPIATRSVLSCP